jgi:hypothetical protein
MKIINDLLRWIAVLLLLSFTLFLAYYPMLRVVDTLFNLDSFPKLPLNFKIDGVQAQWGYAGWAENLGSHFTADPANLPTQNHTLEGQPLSIGSSIFPQGIGTHAPSKISFNLNKKISQFSCLVGLDDSTSNTSNGVYAYLLADGKEIYRSTKIHLQAAPIPINVSVTGVENLVLGVDISTPEDETSNCDWINLQFKP